MILHRALSKGLQSDAALILDLPRMLDNYKQSLQKFAHTLGAEAERRLESLIVKRWLDDDRKAASFVRETTKGEEPRSKVIQRHHAKTTSTFLYK